MIDPVVDRVTNFAHDLAAGMDLELVDVQFRREAHGWVLRVFIDGPEGIGVDDCAVVSRELSDFLDVEDLIDHPYNLEVSSPGLERPLKTLEDFSRFVDNKARLKLREAVGEEKVVIGTIVGVDGEVISVHAEDGREFAVEFSNIRKARLSL
ncbi:MAG: ribosome maturation factor RimP [Thermodesulfobacteriota bacterium]